MKIFGIWGTYVLIAFALFYGFIQYLTSDENRVQHAVTVTVVKLLQEDHKSSTTYRGVFLLPNGKYTDFSITPSTFATIEVGEKVSFNLNKYETKEAEETPIRFLVCIGYMILIILYVACGFGTCIGITKYLKEHPKVKLKLRLDK